MKVTSAAVVKVSQLIREESNPNVNLRVYVEGGGCSGFKYGFTFDENIEEGDFVIENEDIKVVIDPMSFPYLSNAELDYQDGGLSGSQFVISNPGVQHTCGCGSSFSA